MEIEQMVMQKSTEMKAAGVMSEIKNRRSGRAYASTPIKANDVQSLFEAARWAPSSMNEQPWTYLYATNEQPELKEKLISVLNESNRIWASHAPLLILSLYRKNLLRNDLPNGSAKYDLGGANAFLSLQATNLGLNVHQMGGYDRAKAKELLNVPDHYDFGVILAIGYPGDSTSLPEHLQLREAAPRERYIQEEFVKNSIF
jgi:Nitroreductase